MPELDLVVLADPRLDGADGRALATLLEVAVTRGYRTGLLPILARRARTDLAWHPRVRRLVDHGLLWLDPAETTAARLAIIYHLLPIQAALGRRLPIRAATTLLRIDQPPAAEGARQFDVYSETARVMLGATPRLVFGDPLVAAACGASLTWDDDDRLWPPTVAAAAPRERNRSEWRVLGRHVGGGVDALVPPAPCPIAASPELRLAEDAARIVERWTHLPAGWRLVAREIADPATFLDTLDAYLMATGAAWRPWLPPALIEALAAGLPVMVPHALEPALGDAALALEPGAAPPHPAALGGAASSAMIRAARDLWHARWSPAAALARLEAALGPPSPPPGGFRPYLGARRRRRALFLTPNGVGMGHVTRLLAVARRCSSALEPVFLSMSQAVGVVQAYGFLAEYLPYHLQSGETPERWNEALRLRLSEAIAFYDPAVVVFDGNVPYQGLVDARLEHAERPFVWVRRGMWRPDAGREIVDRARHFDLVIEPGELAATDDPGVTAGRRHEVAPVPPIVLLRPEEILPREAARAELGLDPGKVAVMVQLGSRNNFAYDETDRVIAEVLAGRADVEAVHLDWLIGERLQDLPGTMRRLRIFPAARLAKAFDLVISGVGYNSFHELLALGLPTVFVPNENPTMDAQEVRAQWADRHGLALCARVGEPYRLAWALQTLLDEARRRALRERLRDLELDDGAGEAARLIEELAAAAWLPTLGARYPVAGRREAPL